MTQRSCYREYYQGSGYEGPDGLIYDVNCRNFLSVQTYEMERRMRERGSRFAPPVSQGDAETAQRVTSQVKRIFKTGFCVECDADLEQRAEDDLAPITRDLCQGCRQSLWIPADVVAYGLPEGSRVWVRGGKQGRRKVWRVLPGVVYGSTLMKIRVRLFTSWPGASKTARDRENSKDEPRFYERRSLLQQDL